MEAGLWDVKQTGEYLGITQETVYNLVSGKHGHPRLPAVRIGRSIRFRKEDLDKFVEDQVASARTQ